MDFVPALEGTRATVLCPLCGMAMLAGENAANICGTCLSTRVDATDGIPDQIVIYECRGCHRYQRPPWVRAERESKELLALCLKKIPGLNKVKLVNAVFIWTEPHSRRIKVRITIQKEVLDSVKVEQAMVVEFIVQNQQCDDCQRSFTEHTWNSIVQVSQKVDHKRTFFYLEQVILKHNAHHQALSVEATPHGLDFFFRDKSNAIRFVDFLSSIVPTKSKTSEQLVSADLKSNTANLKNTFSVEIVPVCKDDIVCLPKRLAIALGNISLLCIVYRVSNYVYMVDPYTLQTAEMNAEKYWKMPFRSLMTSRRLVEYTVLDITPLPMTDKLLAAMNRRKKSKKRGKHRAAGDFEPTFEAVPEGRSIAGSARRRAGGGRRGGRGKHREMDKDELELERRGLGMPSSAGSTTGGSRGSRGGRKSSVDGSGAGAGAGGGGGGGGKGGPTAYGGKGSAVVIGKPEDADSGSDSDAMSVASTRPFTNTGSRFTKISGFSGVSSTVTGGPRGKFLLAEAEVARTRDLGVTDQRFTVITHLGNILKPGDTAMGYDFSTAVYNDADAAPMEGKEFPDVLLVKKKYERTTRRKWKLKSMLKGGIAPPKRGGETEAEAAQLEQFYQDLEEDRSLRKNVNLYKDLSAISALESKEDPAVVPGPDTIRESELAEEGAEDAVEEAEEGEEKDEASEDVVGEPESEEETTAEPEPEAEAAAATEGDAVGDAASPDA